MKYTIGEAAVLLGCLALMILGASLYWAWSAWLVWNWYAPLAEIPQASFSKVYAFSTILHALMGFKRDYATDEDSKRETMIKFFFGTNILNIVII